MSTGSYHTINCKSQPPPLPQSFYDDVSSIIKLFRRQFTVFLKMSQSFIEQSQLMAQMLKKKQEARHITKEYEALVVDETIYTYVFINDVRIAQRFLARIKEIVQLSAANGGIGNNNSGFLQFVSNSIKKIEGIMLKNIGTATLEQVFSDVLSILPSYFGNCKTFSPSKASKPKPSTNKENIPLATQKKPSPLDLIFESYKKSISVLSTLDIDESQYRALFFSARDQRTRESNTLQVEMKYRNRFIREEMQRFDCGYEGFKEKKKRDRQNLEKRKATRVKRMMSLNNNGIESKTNAQMMVQNEESLRKNDKPINFTKVNEKKQSLSPDFLVLQKPSKSNLLTTYNFNNPSITKQPHRSFYQNPPYLMNKITPRNNYSSKKQSKQKLNKTGCFDKVKEEEFQDFIDEIKVKGEFRMTKVLFGKDGRLQLSPYVAERENYDTLKMKTTGSRNNYSIIGNSNNQLHTLNTSDRNISGSVVSNAIKHKIIFRKAQQNIRKKLNRLTTQPPPFGNNNNKRVRDVKNQQNINLSIDQTANNKSPAVQAISNQPSSLHQQALPLSNNTETNITFPSSLTEAPRNHMNHHHNKNKSKNPTFKEVNVKKETHFLGIKGSNQIKN